MCRHLRRFNRALAYAACATAIGPVESNPAASTPWRSPRSGVLIQRCCGLAGGVNCLDGPVGWKDGSAPFPVSDGGGSHRRQVLANLIGTAVKFTRTRDRAVVRVEGLDDGRETTYVVHDHGVGFDAAYVDRIFGVFQRLHRSDEFEGTGVGLAIVRRVVDRRDGRVWADGKPGEGASVGFAVPRARREDIDGP